jgi:hypothetical protein
VAPEAEDQPLVTELMIISRDWRRKQAPFYSVSDVAKFFFGMSASWLRLKLTPEPHRPKTSFVRNGEPMEFRRRDPGKTDSARVFLLSDIEPMARSLHEFGDIGTQRLVQILDVVRSQVQLYELLDEPGDSGEAQVSGSPQDPEAPGEPALSGQRSAEV